MKLITKKIRRGYLTHPIIMYTQAHDVSLLLQVDIPVQTATTSHITVRSGCQLSLAWPDKGLQVCDTIVHHCAKLCRCNNPRMKGAYETETGLGLCWLSSQAPHAASQHSQA